MRPFAHLAVIGTGTMGTGIATLHARGGRAVTLVDSTLDKARAGCARVQALLDEEVAAGLTTAEVATAAAARVRPSARLEDARVAELVLEAVLEDEHVKRDVFVRLGTICSPQTILATNTSAMAVGELALGVDHPRRVLGLHHLVPAARNPLVEVVAHAEADGAAVADVVALYTGLGRTTMVVRDGPGFVVNRFCVPWIVEALRLEDEGAHPEAIEASAREAFGTARGPFGLLDLVGAADTLRAATYLAARLGPLYAPPRRWRTLVERGGRLAAAPLGAGVPSGPIAGRLWGVVLHATASLVSDGVADIDAVDLAARLGLRWRRPPGDEIRARGREGTAELAASIERRHGLPTPRALGDESSWSTLSGPRAVARR